MKKFKKVFAVLLTLAMVLGMSMTSFAADEQSKITIDGIPDGATVTYQQIAIANPSDPIGWSLAEGVTLQNGVKLEDLVKVGGGNNNASAGTIGNATVDKAIKGMTLSETLASGVNEITGVTPGLYAINVVKDGWTFNPMLAYVAWNKNNSAAVTETKVSVKGAPDQVNKAITVVEGENHTSVSEGDVVPFTITTKYPYLSNSLTNRKFVITDTVSGGTMVKEDDTVVQPVIKIGDTEVTDKDVTVTATETGFTATFKYDSSKAGQTVEITYSVLVGAGTDALKNTVSSTFGSEEDGDTTTESKVISPKVNVVVKKVDENQKALPGATFDLYVETSDGATHKLDGNKIVSATEGATLKKVSSGTTQMTGSDAGVTFDELDADKTYYVVESKAPNGYALNETPYKLTGAEITAGTPVEKWLNNKDEEVTKDTEGARKVMVTENTVKSNFVVNNGSAIINTTLSSLPSTGGIGTTIFTIGGCAIMIIAAGLFFASRRKSAK